MVIISERVWNEHQSWNFQRTVATRHGQLRTTIRRNAYDEQSWSKVERWDGSRWQEVVSIPIEFLSCKSLSYVVNGITKKEFAADAKFLQEEALKVVGLAVLDERNIGDVNDRKAASAHTR